MGHAFSIPPFHEIAELRAFINDSPYFVILAFADNWSHLTTTISNKLVTAVELNRFDWSEYIYMGVDTV